MGKHAALTSTLVALLLAASPAAGKQLAAAQVCGAAACRVLDVPDARLAVMDAGGHIEPPRPAPFYLVRVTLRGGGAEGRRIVDRFSLAYLPSARALRGTGAGGAPVWTRVAPSEARALERAGGRAATAAGDEDRAHGRAGQADAARRGRGQHPGVGARRRVDGPRGRVCLCDPRHGAAATTSPAPRDVIRAGLLLAVGAALAAASQASAKGIASADACGASACRTVSDPAMLRRLLVLGRRLPEPRSAPFYRVRLNVLTPDNVILSPRARAAARRAFTLVYLPSARAVLRTNVDGEEQWLKLDSEEQRVFGRLTAGLRPMPAGRIDAVDEPLPIAAAGIAGRLQRPVLFSDA